jgi:uncharacterized protein YndB with AHSA1/START domain
MTSLTRSVEILRAPEIVWEMMDMRRWPDISKIFSEITLTGSSIAEGARLSIVAGPGEEKVRYTAEITACEAPRRLSYKRTGGPLPGESEWHLTPSARGTMITYTNKYDHDLATPVQASICRAMEKFLEEMARVVQEP